MNVAHRRQCDPCAWDKLHLRAGVEAFDLVAGLAQGVGEGHRVTRRVRGGKKLFRAGASVVAPRAGRPCDRELVECAARPLDPTLACGKVALPDRIRTTDSRHGFTSKLNDRLAGNLLLQRNPLRAPLMPLVSFTTLNAVS